MQMATHVLGLEFTDDGAAAALLALLACFLFLDLAHADGALRTDGRGGGGDWLVNVTEKNSRLSALCPPLFMQHPTNHLG